MSLREIRVLYGEPRTGNEHPGPVDVRNPRSVAAIVAPLLEREASEVGVVLCLTTKMALIGYHEVCRGCLNATTMHPREVFKAAVLSNAAAIVLCHNHPSGDPTPSPDDIVLTARIRDAGQLMGIDLLDHVIIGHGGRFVSVRQHGLLSCL
jgi:DNA repair protein RadC